MRNFSVFVTGITAFVEDYRRALAVNAPEPVSMRVAGDDGKPMTVTIPAHFPYVRIPADRVDDQTRARFRIRQNWHTAPVNNIIPPDLSPLDALNLNRATLVRFLRFHEVQLPASETPRTENLKPLAGPTPTEADKHSLLWLTPMNRLGTDATRIDQKHIVPDPPDVAAYVRFPNGHMSTALPTGVAFVSVNAEDGKETGSLNQAAAQLIVCTIEVPDGPFEVTCRGYNGATTFRIEFAADLPDPWMLFACTSLEDAMQILPMDQSPGIDHHFRLVYALAEKQGRAGDIKLPRSLPPTGGGGGPMPLGALKCVPPRFDGGATAGQP